MKRSTFAVCFLTCSMAVQCFAAAVVAPNANAASEGNANISGPFQASGITFQWIMAASQFASVPAGTQLTAIGFRLDGESATLPTGNLAYTNWNLQLSTSLNAVGSLSAAFASNIGGDVTSVKSGALTINANSFSGGAGPTPFFFIGFTTPYTYNGGNLLVTLRHDTSTGTGFANDGVTFSSIPGIGDTVLANTFAATIGTAQSFNMPVTAFQFNTAVPEPATWLSMVGGLVLIGWRYRRAA